MGAILQQKTAFKEVFLGKTPRTLPKRHDRKPSIKYNFYINYVDHPVITKPSGR
jgi:hypothetical protein